MVFLTVKVSGFYTLLSCRLCNMARRKNSLFLWEIALAANLGTVSDNGLQSPEICTVEKLYTTNMTGFYSSL